jgi:hydrogenase expression/formation protein HypC
MCLSVPGKVVEKKGLAADVDVGGTIRKISLKFVPEAKVGEYVLVHTGFAMQIVDEEEANEMMKLLKELTDGPVS